MKNEKGMALIHAMLFVLIAFGGILSVTALSQSHMTVAESISDSNKAFYLAESGYEKAIYELSQSTGWGGVTAQTLGEGEYSVANPVSVGINAWLITSTGFIPSAANPQFSRTIQVTAQIIALPTNFFDGALFTSGEIDVSGNAHLVNGDVIAGDEVDDDLNITGGTISEFDPDAQNLPLLDFQQLQTLAQGQTKADGSDNHYTATEIAAGTPALPASFYFDTTDPDPANWVPNIVYIESDLDLSGHGNQGANAGGILLVVGNILVNGNVTAETEISGNANVDGLIYTTGSFTVNGGGNTLNINGSVWAGDDGVDINGNADIVYNGEYMAIAQNFLNSNSLQITGWTEAN